MEGESEEQMEMIWGKKGDKEGEREREREAYALCNSITHIRYVTP